MTKTGAYAEIVEAVTQWLAAAQAEGACVAVLEGLPQAGKTSIAKEVGAALSWAVVELDTFAEGLNRPDLSWVELVRLGGACEGITRQVAEGSTLIEGAVAWPVVEAWAAERGLGSPIARAYIKRVTVVGERVFWDELDVPLGPDAGCAMVSIFDYHRDSQPWEAADVVFERIDD